MSCDGQKPPKKPKNKLHQFLHHKEPPLPEKRVHRPASSVHDFVPSFSVQRNRGGVLGEHVQRDYVVPPLHGHAFRRNKKRVGDAAAAAFAARWGVDRLVER